MKDLLEKLSSYNLFNYLLPGTIFVAAAEILTDYRFTRTNIVVELFVYYFIGLVISRLGSLVVEPLMKSSGFASFAPYKAFVKACAADSKIELLSEQNNMFRTLCALFLALPLFKAGDALEPATHRLQVADELATNFGPLGDPVTVASSPRSCNTRVAHSSTLLALREDKQPLTICFNPP